MPESVYIGGMNRPKKYEYDDDEQRLIAMALVGGRTGSAVFAGPLELMLLAWVILMQIASFVNNAGGAWDVVARLYAKVLGNVVSDEKMPDRVKQRQIQEFLAEISSLDESQLKELGECLAGLLDETDAKKLQELLPAEPSQVASGEDDDESEPETQGSG